MPLWLLKMVWVKTAVRRQTKCTKEASFIWSQPTCTEMARDVWQCLAAVAYQPLSMQNGPLKETRALINLVRWPPAMISGRVRPFKWMQCTLATNKVTTSWLQCRIKSEEHNGNIIWRTNGSPAQDIDCWLCWCGCAFSLSGLFTAKLVLEMAIQGCCLSHVIYLCMRTYLRILVISVWRGKFTPSSSTSHSFWSSICCTHGLLVTISVMKVLKLSGCALSAVWMSHHSLKMMTITTHWEVSSCEVYYSEK